MVRGYRVRKAANPLIIQRRDAASSIQRVWRRYYCRIDYCQTLGCVITIQSIFRMAIGKRMAAKRLDSVVKVQCVARKWLAVRELIQIWIEMDCQHRLLSAVVFCQVRSQLLCHYYLPRYPC